MTPFSSTTPTPVGGQRGQERGACSPVVNFTAGGCLHHEPQADAVTGPGYGARLEQGSGVGPACNHDSPCSRQVRP